MKALVLRDYSRLDSMQIEEQAVPTPASGEVLIRVNVAGISYADVLTAEGRYQVKPPLPWVPGSECAGVVESVGAEVTGLKPGDRVCVLAWGGVIAEWLCVEASAATRLPDEMDIETGAIIRVAYTTSWHALVDRAQIQPAEKVLVLGAAGAVGRAAVEIGKALGAHVIAAASIPEKRATAMAAGADSAVDSDPAALRSEVESAHGRKSIDIIFDPVGGAGSEQAFRLLGPGGRYCVVGFAAGGDLPKLPLNLPLLIDGSVIGVNVGLFNRRFPAAALANLHTMFALWREGRLRPQVAQRFPLVEAAAAFSCVRFHRPMGRVVVNL